MVFNPQKQHHIKIGEIAEQVLDQEDELKTSELAEKIASRHEYTPGYIHPLLTDGSEYLTGNYDLEIEKKRGGSGGNQTFHWSKK